MRTACSIVRDSLFTVTRHNFCFVLGVHSTQHLLYQDIVRLMAMVSYHGIHYGVFQHTHSEFWAAELVVIRLEICPCAHNTVKHVDEYLPRGAWMDSLQGSPVLDAGKI